MDLSEFVIVAITVLLDLLLGGMALQRNSRSTTHRLFAAASVSMSVWLAVNFMCDQPMFYGHALFLNRLAITTATTMGIPLVAFVVCYPRKKASLSWEWWAGLAPLVAIGAISLSTPLVVKDVTIEPWGTNVTQGDLFIWMSVYGLLLLSGIAVMLFRRYRAADARQRAQYKYLYLGLGLFFSTTMFFTTLLPMMTGTNEFAKLLPVCTLLLLVPTAYAIIRHELMDVSLVVLRSAAYSLTMLVFAGVIVGVAQLARTQIAPALGLEPDALVFLAGLVAVIAFQRVRLLVEHATDDVFFRRTYDPSKLLNDLGKRMASTFDEAELACMLSAELAEKMRLTYATVVFRADNDRFVTCTSQGGFDGPELTKWLHDHEDRVGLVVTDDFDADSEDVAVLNRAGIRVLAPLRREGVLLGAIALGAKRSGVMFSEHDIRFFDVLVPEAVIAMNNARLFDERNQRVRELTALNRLATALGSSIELQRVLNGALKQVVTVTEADSGSIMLLDGATQTLTVAAAEGVDPAIVSSSQMHLGEGIAGWVAESRKALVLPRDTTPSFAHELLRDDIASSICTPVISKGTVIGVLNVNRGEPCKPFSQENLNVVSSFAGQLGVAIENARLFEDLERTFLGTIGALAAAVDAKDPYTYGHSNEVTHLAVDIAQALGLAEQEVQRIRIAATLHDIGKIGIDGEILLKTGELTAEERELINRHPTIGASILAPLDFLRDTVPYILFHHERFGGGGYPNGIRGETIPLGARIISVADSYNAMVSDRPYRKGLSREEAIEELRANSGTQFDPRIVNAFLKTMGEETADNALAVVAPFQPAMTTALRR